MRRYTGSRHYRQSTKDPENTRSGDMTKSPGHLAQDRHSNIKNARMDTGKGKSCSNNHENAIVLTSLFNRQHGTGNCQILLKQREIVGRNRDS